MSDLISRDKVIDLIMETDPEWAVGMTRAIFEGVKHMPPAQMRIKTGKWEWSLADNGWADWTCSVCGYTNNTDIHVKLGWRYCPHCGADMRGEEDDR